MIGLVVLGSGRAEQENPKKPVKNEAKEDWSGKTVKFEMRDKPWSQVLEWLADQTNLQVILIKDNKPTGTFTYIAPKNEPKEFTIPQVIDILNQSLEGQNYLLIRRSGSYTIARSDARIDPAMVPRISVDELKQHGETEVASVVLQLRSLVTEDLVKEVGKMMGPFGDPAAIGPTNQLVLQDTVGNLKRVIKTLQDYESNEKGQVSTFSHTCKYINARDAEKNLKDLLGDPRELARQMQPQQFGGFGGNFGGRGGNRFGDGQPLAPAQPIVAVPKIRMHYITVDDRLNMVLVTGPANITAQAKEIMDRIDKQQGDEEARPPGPPFLKVYNVPAGNAEALVAILKERFLALSNVRITAAGTSSILVWGSPGDQIEIGKQVLGGGEKSTKTQLFKLNVLDASKTAETLSKKFGESKTGAPYVEADSSRNAIVVIATQEQIDEVQNILKGMGEVFGKNTGMRIISLEKAGGAATVAEALGRLLPQMLQNPVRVDVLTPGEKKRGSQKEIEPP